MGKLSSILKKKSDNKSTDVLKKRVTSVKFKATEKIKENETPLKKVYNVFF